MKNRKLFEGTANRARLQAFTCDGFASPVVGTIYPRASFRWHGVPLGGLGTGFVTWDGDGRWGQCTLFNQVPTGSGVPILGTIPFRLSANGRSWALAMRDKEGHSDLVDLKYFGHFPIVDAVFVIDAPLALEIRVFGPDGEARQTMVRD